MLREEFGIDVTRDIHFRVNYCQTDKLACWDEPNSFRHHIDFFGFIEFGTYNDGIFNDDTTIDQPKDEEVGEPETQN